MYDVIFFFFFFFFFCNSDSQINSCIFKDFKGSLCNVCEKLICKLVYLFIVFVEHGRYINNINRLW